MIYVYLAIYSDLKIDQKLQKATEAICFLLYSQLANQITDWSAYDIVQVSNDIVLNKILLFCSKTHVT